jgi:hypothetical protein
MLAMVGSTTHWQSSQADQLKLSPLLPGFSWIGCYRATNPRALQGASYDTTLGNITVEICANFGEPAYEHLVMMGC